MNDDPMFYYTRQYDEIDLFIIIKHAVCEPKYFLLQTNQY